MIVVGLHKLRNSLITSSLHADIKSDGFSAGLLKN